MMKPVTTALLAFWASICLSMAAWGEDMAASTRAQADVGTATKPSGQGPLVVLYASPASGQLLRLSALDMKARINMWRDLLRERGDNYRIVTHPGQWADVPHGVAIVLVSAYALSEQEQALLQQRLDGGDSLLATGYPASRDEGDKAIESSFVSRVFGPTASLGTPTPTGEFMVVVGDTPLTYPIPTGTRLWIDKDSKGKLPALRATGAGYVSDWSRRPEASGVLSYANVGTSRRVLLGWPETAWDARNKDWRTLAATALDYVEGHAIAYLQTWPAPYQAAMSFGVNASWRIENLQKVAKLFEEQQVKASFYLLAPDLAAHASTLSKLAESGHDVASLGDVWRPFAGQSAEEQERRVRVSARALRQALGDRSSLSGLRTPEGATDANTEAAVAREGGQYLVDLGRIDSALPLLTQSGQLTLLPSTLTLDADNAAATQQWGDSLADERNRALKLHALAYVGLDDAAAAPDGATGIALREFLAQTQQQSQLWLASAAQISQWWKLRQHIKLQTRQENADLLLTLQVDTDTPVSFPVAIALTPPPGRPSISMLQAPSNAQLESRADGTALLTLRDLSPGMQLIRLHFSATR